MPYPALPAARRMHYEIDGTVIGYNIDAGSGAGLQTVLSAAQMLAFDEETPTINTEIVHPIWGTTTWFYFLFPELVDLSYLLTRAVPGDNTPTFGNLAGSTDTTNGADGTWTAITNTGTPLSQSTVQDWWRSSSPATLTANNNGLKGMRFTLTSSQGGLNQGISVRNCYLWGHKHAGATPDDIIFLEADATTEWPNDDDWGDINAGAAAATHTYYVQNTSVSKTANTITVKSSGSDNAKWTVSLDNASFAASQSIASLAPGATRVVYFKFTPPSPASGVYRPYAGYLEADVTSWT